MLKDSGKNFIGDERDLSNEFFEQVGLNVLVNLRRIMRSVGQYSRWLSKEYNVTSPQLFCLYTLDRQPNGSMAIGALAKAVQLGPSTVDGIIDRLETRGLVVRSRHIQDRRRVDVQITDEGREFTLQAPFLMQDRLQQALRDLPEMERAAIAMAIEKVADLMSYEEAHNPSETKVEMPPF